MRSKKNIKDGFKLHILDKQVYQEIQSYKLFIYFIIFASLKGF